MHAIIYLCPCSLSAGRKINWSLFIFSYYITINSTVCWGLQKNSLFIRHTGWEKRLFEPKSRTHYFFPFYLFLFFFFLMAMCCESRLLLLQSNDHCDVLTWLFTIHLHALVAVFVLTVIINDIHRGTVLLIDAWSLSHPSWLHLVTVQNPDLESTIKASRGLCSLYKGLNTHSLFHLFQLLT